MIDSVGRNLAQVALEPLGAEIRAADQYLTEIVAADRCAEPRWRFLPPGSTSKITPMLSRQASKRSMTPGWSVVKTLDVSLWIRLRNPPPSTAMKP